MHTSPLKLQAFLADPLLSLLMIPVILLFIFIIGTVQHQLKKLGVHGRQFQHSFDFKAKSMLMNKLKKTRLISNSFFEAVVWGYYGIVCTICLFSFQQRSLGGAVVAYAAGELYLLVAENVVGFTAGHEGTLMIEAFGKTIELSHNGLWERLNRCTTSVFATTASQIMDVYHHTALRNWSDKKLKEKTTKDAFKGIVRGLSEELDMQDAKFYTYGRARVIKEIIVLDESIVLNLAKETCTSFKHGTEEQL